jgi:hypothetical protein
MVLGKVALIACIILFSIIGVAAAVVFSLISIYVPKHSVATSGIEL